MNFSSQSGLFGKRLLSSENREQTVRDYSVESVAMAIRERRPTRRIILPVATSDELDAPLGLTAIQIMPRQREGKWHLDFHWIWRTVEVLVGFSLQRHRIHKDGRTNSSKMCRSDFKREAISIA